MPEVIGISGRFSIIESKKDLVVSLEHAGTTTQLVMSECPPQVRMAMQMMRARNGSLVRKVAKLLECEPDDLTPMPNDDGLDDDGE